MRLVTTSEAIRTTEGRLEVDPPFDSAQALHRSDEGLSSLAQLVQILLRRRLLIIALTLGSTALAAAGALLVRPQYTGTAQLIVERSTTTINPQVLDELIDTHIALLRSRQHFERVAESILASEATALREITEAHNGIAGLARTYLRLIPADFASRIAIWLGQDDEQPRERVVDQLTRKVRVLQEQRSRIISVSFTARDPSAAAFVANSIAQSYVVGLERHAKTDALEKSRTLDAQIAALLERKRVAEEAERAAIRLRNMATRGENADLVAADRTAREQAREAQEASQAYEALLQRRTGILGAPESGGVGIGFYSGASPPRWPSSHNPLLFAAATFFFVLILACWMAIVLERSDRSLRSEAEIRRGLGIPSVGLVPRAPSSATVSPGQHFRANPTSLFSEAIRGIVVTLRLASRTEPQVLLVASSLPGEGKSTIAKGLTAYLAMLGRRVILVDLDLPAAADRLHARTALDGDMPLASQIRDMIECWEPGVDRLLLSELDIDPLLLFSTGTLPDLLSDLRKSYEFIVLVGPPLIGRSEAKLLPALADRVIFLVRWGKTRKDVAANALDLVWEAQPMDIRRRGVVAAVLTHVDLRRYARYRFGDPGEFALTLHKSYMGRRRVTRSAVSNRYPGPLWRRG